MDYICDDNSTETFFRSIILFGANVASYKFALGKSLLEIDMNEQDFVTLEELAVPFSKHLVQHVKTGKRQTTSRSSQFLYACQLYADNKISEDELITITKKYGFNYVLDAFHNVPGTDGRKAFFEKSVRGSAKGITLTDELFNLHNYNQYTNLQDEIEGRWNLVESSWEEKNPNMVLEYDTEEEILFTSRERSNSSYLNSHLRTPVTSVRYPISGYQKGKCFYCFSEISTKPGKHNTADVDHFFPISLQYNYRNVNLNLNGVWNLVLSCQDCNRGIYNGKFAHTPSRNLLERLEKRNNYYIESQHPLGDTIVNQTGHSVKERRVFLSRIFDIAKQRSKYEWAPITIKGTRF